MADESVEQLRSLVTDQLDQIRQKVAQARAIIDGFATKEHPNGTR